MDLLVTHGAPPGEPYTKQLDGKLRELRFHLGGEALRITYWIASGRRMAVRRCIEQAHTVDER
nr:type II toxin-antitoxin system RelE/ParE family toxin [Streptomyces odonnellii]